MHFLIIGGSGRTGEMIIDEALAKGHQATALVRKVSSLAPRDNLTIVEGTPLNAADIGRAFTATASVPSAVVVALNARRAADSPFAAPSPDTPPRMMADSVANAIRSMKQHGVRKIVIMSSMGTGSSFAGLNFLMRILFTKSNMRLQMEDHNLVDTETRQANVDFVLVRPVMLADGPTAATKVFPDCGKGSGFMPKITRSSVAKFMVEALEGDRYIGTAPVISN
jgi:nucleoside-diphosphate-sugar epimerase